MAHHKEKFLSFDRKNQRLDDFFFQSMKVEDKYPDLALVMKIVLTLSHRQASVEQGFNDNNLVLKQNLKKESITARRLIKNYMSANSFKPRTITINQKLERSIKAAWGRYNQQKKRRRK